MARRPLRAAMSSIGAGLTVAAAGCAVQSCYGATEIRLALSTNADCKLHTQTQILVGTSREPVAVRDVCNDNEDPNLGTLTLVPSGDRDGTVFVKVVAAFGLPPEQCAALKAPDDAKKCIIARRRLRYIPHDALDLPIVLRDSCRGVLCSEDETCDVDACTPIKNCDFDGCIREKSTDAGAAADAPVDSSGDAGDAGDAGLGCTTLAEGQAVNGGLYLTPTRLWWPSSSPAEIRFIDKPGSAVTSVSLPANGTPIAVAATADEPPTVAFATSNTVGTFVLGGTGAKFVNVDSTFNFLQLTPSRVLAVGNASFGTGLLRGFNRDNIMMMGPVTTVTGPIGPNATATTASAVYVVFDNLLGEYDANTLSGPAALTFQGLVPALASNGNDVFFVQQGMLKKFAPASSRPLDIATGVSAQLIAATSTAIYVISPAPANLYRIALGNEPGLTAPVLIGPVPADVKSLRAEIRPGGLGRVYWVEQNGTRIVRCDVP